MLNTVTQWVKALSSISDQNSLLAVLVPMADRLSSQAFGSAGLVQGSTAQLAKNGTLFQAIVKGRLVTVAANTDTAALVGTVTNAKFNVYCFYIDQSGVQSSGMGQEGATRVAIGFPPIPKGKVMYGFIIINPTGTGNFVGGTTSVVDATVVPNVVYVNTPGAFDPSILA